MSESAHDARGFDVIHFSRSRCAAAVKGKRRARRGRERNFPAEARKKTPRGKNQDFPARKIFSRFGALSVCAVVCKEVENPKMETRKKIVPLSLRLFAHRDGVGIGHDIGAEGSLLTLRGVRVAKEKRSA